MKQSFYKSLVELKLYWKNYLWQSLLATAVIFLIILLFNADNNILIASLGATTFIVFAMPNSITANPRNLIGGYLLGVLSGVLFLPIQRCVFIDPLVCHSMVYALAVGLSIFIMVITDTEHPPASGISLSIAMTGFEFSVIGTVIASAVALSLCHTLLKNKLHDLT
jgi:CBS-domain-containing membrane protein